MMNEFVVLRPIKRADLQWYHWGWVYAAVSVPMPYAKAVAHARSILVERGAGDDKIMLIYNNGTGRMAAVSKSGAIKLDYGYPKTRTFKGRLEKSGLITGIDRFPINVKTDNLL